MKPRSKKYYQRRKEDSMRKKGLVVSEAGYNDENKIISKQSRQKNPAPPKSKEDPSVDTITSQGDSDIVVEKKNE